MSEQENALGKAASAYLRSARHQPIEWNEWGAEAFAKAKRENTMPRYSPLNPPADDAGERGAADSPPW